MKTTKSTHRRNFLLAAGLGGAGVAAGVAAATAGKAKKPEAVGDAGESSSTTAYRASPHVLKYYKTTEV